MSAKTTQSSKSAKRVLENEVKVRFEPVVKVEPIEMIPAAVIPLSGVDSSNLLVKSQIKSEVVLGRELLDEMIKMDGILQKVGLKEKVNSFLAMDADANEVQWVHKSHSYAFVYRNGPHERPTTTTTSVLNLAQAQDSQMERKSTIEEIVPAELVGHNRIHLDNLQFHQFLTSVGQGQLTSCDLQIVHADSAVNAGKLKYRFALNHPNANVNQNIGTRYLESEEKLNLEKQAETVPSQLSLPNHFPVGVQVQLNLLVVISIIDNLYAREVDDGKLLRITVTHSSCSFLRVSGLKSKSAESEKFEFGLPFTVSGCVTSTSTSALSDNQNCSLVTHFDLIKFAKLIAFVKELIERNHANASVNVDDSNNNISTIRSPFFVATAPAVRKSPSSPSYEVFFSFDHYCLLTFKSNPDVCKERMIIMPWCEQQKVDEPLTKTVVKVANKVKAVSKVAAKTASAKKKTTSTVKLKKAKKTA